MVDLNSITQLIETRLAGSDKFLVDVKLSPGKLSVFIDKPAGIKVEECSEMNRYLFTSLEPDGFTDTHEIEVSSPGMDQPMKVYQQYLRRLGRELKIITNEGKQHKGKLLAADNTGFELLEVIETKENKKKIKRESNLKLSYSDIKETKLVF